MTQANSLGKEVRVHDERKSVCHSFTDCDGPKTDYSVMVNYSLKCLVTSHGPEYDSLCIEAQG